MKILLPARAAFSRAGTPLFCLFLASLLFTASGCTSPVANITIVNRGPAVQLVEFDYPNASFGIDNLKPGARFEYPINIQGSGHVMVQFKDRSGAPHSSTGPIVRKGEKGVVTAEIDASGDVRWSSDLTGAK